MSKLMNYINIWLASPTEPEQLMVEMPIEPLEPIKLSIWQRFINWLKEVLNV